MQHRSAQVVVVIVAAKLRDQQFAVSKQPLGRVMVIDLVCSAMDHDRTITNLANLAKAICHLCQQDVPVDPSYPNLLIRHVCIRHVFVLIPSHSIAVCYVCEKVISFVNGNKDEIINHFVSSWCRDEARRAYNLPKTYMAAGSAGGPNLWIHLACSECAYLINKLDPSQPLQTGLKC